MRAILARRESGDSGYIQLQRACTGVITIREYAGHWCETMILLLWLYSPVEEDGVDIFTIRNHYDYSHCNLLNGPLSSYQAGLLPTSSDKPKGRCGLFVFCAAVSVYPMWLTKQVAWQCQIQKATTPHLGPRRLGQSEGHASAASLPNLKHSSLQ
jgi:hypothetical protein